MTVFLNSDCVYQIATTLVNTNDVTLVRLHCSIVTKMPNRSSAISMVTPKAVAVQYHDFVTGFVTQVKLPPPVFK